jgi:hypothetical protein
LLELGVALITERLSKTHHGGSIEVEKMGQLASGHEGGLGVGVDEEVGQLGKAFGHGGAFAADFVFEGHRQVPGGAGSEKHSFLQEFITGCGENAN